MCPYIPLHPSPHTPSLMYVFLFPSTHHHTLLLSCMCPYSPPPITTHSFSHVCVPIPLHPSPHTPSIHVCVPIFPSTHHHTLLLYMYVSLSPSTHHHTLLLSCMCPYIPLHPSPHTPSLMYVSLYPPPPITTHSFSHVCAPISPSTHHHTLLLSCMCPYIPLHPSPHTPSLPAR